MIDVSEWYIQSLNYTKISSHLQSRIAPQELGNPPQKKKTPKNHPRNDDATTIGASDEETYTFQTTATHAAQGIQWNAPAKSSKNHSKDMSRWMSIFGWIQKYDTYEISSLLLWGRREVIPG